MTIRAMAPLSARRRMNKRRGRSFWDLCSNISDSRWRLRGMFRGSRLLVYWLGSVLNQQGDVLAPIAIEVALNLQRIGPQFRRNVLVNGGPVRCLIFAWKMRPVRSTYSYARLCQIAGFRRP